MLISDRAAGNSNGFTVQVFPVAWWGSLLFSQFLNNIFISPCHNSENSFFILICPQERQFVFLSKHKHISLTCYSNKYWRIPAIYLGQVTTKTAKTKQLNPSPEEQDWGIPGLFIFIQVHFCVAQFQIAGCYQSKYPGIQHMKSRRGSWLYPSGPILEKA